MIYVVIEHRISFRLEVVPECFERDYGADFWKAQWRGEAASRQDALAAYFHDRDKAEATSKAPTDMYGTPLMQYGGLTTAFAAQLLFIIGCMLLYWIGFPR